MLVVLLFVVVCAEPRSAAFDDGSKSRAELEEAALELLATEGARARQESDMRALVGFGSVAAIESFRGETRACAEVSAHTARSSEFF